MPWLVRGASPIMSSNLMAISWLSVRWLSRLSWCSGVGGVKLCRLGGGSTHPARGRRIAGPDAPDNVLNCA